MNNLTLRQEVRPTDIETVRTIVESTGMFYPYEVDIAVELVQERLNRGPASGYFFVFAEWDGQVVGYSCYGPIACTVNSYDLFWIAVRQDIQNRGIGKTLLQESEKLIAAAGGKRIYAETSSRPQYAPTRAYYERNDYILEATLKDFYAPDDGKAIYVKVVG